MNTIVGYRAGQPIIHKPIATIMPPLLLRAKCVLVGDSGVGKSAIAQSFHSDGTHFPKAYTMVSAGPRCGAARTAQPSASRSELRGCTSEQLSCTCDLCNVCGMGWLSEWITLQSAYPLPSPPPHAQTKGVEICVKTVALPDSKDSVVSENLHGLMTC